MNNIHEKIYKTSSCLKPVLCNDNATIMQNSGNLDLSEKEIDTSLLLQGGVPLGGGESPHRASQKVPPCGVLGENSVLSEDFYLSLKDWSLVHLYKQLISLYPGKAENHLPLAMALEENGEPKWAKRHLLCGIIAGTTAIACKTCGHPEFRRFTCGLRGCPDCSKAYANKIHATYSADLIRHFSPDPHKMYNLRLLTLTFKSVPNIGDIDYQRLLSYLYNFTRRIEVKHKILKIMYRFELTHTENGYHPHFHLLIYGLFFNQKQISSIWSDVTGGSLIVDIRAIRSAKSALNEVVKYIGKPDNFSSVDDHAKYSILMRGRRLFGVHGFKKVYSVSMVCPVCGGTDWSAPFVMDVFAVLNQQIIEYQQKKSTLANFL